MKIFVVSDIPVKQYVLDSKVDGIELEIPVYTLFGFNGAGYLLSTASVIKKELKKIGVSGKKATLSILWGNDCGNVIWHHYPYLEFVRKHHANSDEPGNPIAVKQPLPYDSGYLIKVEETISWLAAELKKDAVAYSVLENVKITGVNETTAEMRMTAQDFTDTEDPATAYAHAAAKWLNSGYSYENAYKACVKMIEIFSNSFNDKILMLPYIPAGNGFPCVAANGTVCKPRERPMITADILYSNLNFQPQYTAYNGTQIRDRYVQINRQRFGMPESGEKEAEFSAMMQAGKGQGVLYMEIFDRDVLYYPGLFE